MKWFHTILAKANPKHLWINKSSKDPHEILEKKRKCIKTKKYNADLLTHPSKKNHAECIRDSSKKPMVFNNQNPRNLQLEFFIKINIKIHLKSQQQSKS